MRVSWSAGAHLRAFGRVLQFIPGSDGYAMAIVMVDAGQPGTYAGERLRQIKIRDLSVEPPDRL